MLNAAVRIRPAIAQERPIAPHFLDACEVHLGDHQLLFLARLRDHDAEWIAHEGVAPELEAGALAAQLFEADTIDRRDPAAVRDGVAALDRSPGVELLRPVPLSFGGMPTDRGRIEQDVGALQRR